jgi:hypothetical protein
MSKASEEFENTLIKVIKQAEEATITGRKYTEIAQTIIDLANAIIILNKISPDVSDIEYRIADWENLGYSLQIAQQGIETIYIPMLSSTAGTATVSSSDAYDPQFFKMSTPRTAWPAVEEALATILRIITREADEKHLVDLMINIGLDKAESSKKSPVELILTGFQAFKAPITKNNPVSTSLIPIRTAIELSINRLLKQKQTQEETKAWHAKILSIGNQLKRDEISIETIESLAHNWDHMLDKCLSPSKEQNIKREEWEIRIKEVTVWFRSFLESLDPKKFRVPVKLRK